MAQAEVPTLLVSRHADHCVRCLRALAARFVEADSSRMVMAFYCISTLDILGLLEDKTKEKERADWKEWIWNQLIPSRTGAGFRAGPSMDGTTLRNSTSTAIYDSPHIIMTFSALLSLAILRDDFARLKSYIVSSSDPTTAADPHTESSPPSGTGSIVRFLAEMQQEDGSFSAFPGSIESDLRITYCVFVICDLLNDWKDINVEKALQFITKCRSYEGGYGQSPGLESHGGTTFCALSCLALAPLSTPPSISADQFHSAGSLIARFLTPWEIRHTTRWLVNRQVRVQLQTDESDSDDDTENMGVPPEPEPQLLGGFQGRTEKDADACYSFWCGGSLAVLGARDLVNAEANSSWLAECQFKWGGIANMPGSNPDPFHTYLSLASLSIYPTNFTRASASADGDTRLLKEVYVAVNATLETAEWAKKHLQRKEALDDA